MSITYKITASGMYILNGEELAASVFPNYGTHTDFFFNPEGFVLITFNNAQEINNLGPLIKVVEFQDYSN